MALMMKGETILMDEKDFGQSLPFDITGAKFEAEDKVLFELRREPKSNSILKKELENVSEDENKLTVNLMFDEEETKDLPAGRYVYYLIFVRDGELRDTITSGAEFRVEDGS